MIKSYCKNHIKVTLLNISLRGASEVMVIVIGIGHGDMSSNPGRDWLHFT